MRQGLTRRAAGVMAIVIALSVAASTASAATPLKTGLARWHSWSLARTGAAPRVNFASSLFLNAGPREVLISGIRYEMELSAFEFPGSPPVTPSVSVELSRAAPLTGPATAFQFHDYNFNPQSGATFTFTPKTLATESLDMGSSVSPTLLDTTFTAAGPPMSTACRLVTGGHGFRRIATGTMAYSAFNIVTPTSPFFGTLTTGPVKAQTEYDPGCSGGVIVVFGAQRAPQQPCPGRESLDAATETQEWGFDKAFGQRLVGETVFTGPNPGAQSVTTDDHGIIAQTSIYTLPRATHSPHGATAKAFTAGNPFMTGWATFTSTRAPVISRDHTCIAGGKTRHFNTYKYAGQLVPAGSPMTAVFDTAPLALTPLTATLALHLYP